MSSYCDWEFDGRHSWHYTDGIHTRGWVTALAAEDGSGIASFDVWFNDPDGSVPRGGVKTLELAKKKVEQRD